MGSLGGGLFGSPEKVHMGTDDGQGQLTLIGNSQLAVDALGVGFHGAESQTHVRCDREHLLARQDMLDEFQFPGGKSQIFAHAWPLYGIEKCTTVVGGAGCGRPR